jgi:hypothetical protein
MAQPCCLQPGAAVLVQVLVLGCVRVCVVWHTAAVTGCCCVGASGVVLAAVRQLVVAQHSTAAG